MNTARDWKGYYADERAALGEEGLHACLERAMAVELPPGGALVFPHTRLRESGELPAAAALAVLRSGCEEVLALGVLHGGRTEDAELVRRAWVENDPTARQVLRRVHGPGAADDSARWTEEFSLDGFCALLAAAARREGKRVPRVVYRYPFLVGETPEDLPGANDLREMIARGAAVVATTDPIHHGIGYGNPPEAALAMASPQAEMLTRWAVEGALDALEDGDYARFQQVTAEQRSDFRDVGPVLAHLLAGGRGLRSEVHAVRRVDYAAALETPPPTWVGAALFSLVGG